MSKKGFYEPGAQDTNFRRTWDKEEYERRARERARQDREREDDDDRKRKGLKAKHSGSEAEQPRDLLKARTERVVLDTNLNKIQVVQSTGLASKQPGFHCKECDCVVKDSVNFLDHINGKKHQRALGMTMKVERSSLEQVKAKMAELKKKKEEGPEIYDFDAQIEKSQKQEEEEKRRKKERKKAKKKSESGKNDINGESGKDDANEEDINPEMEKLMGFGNFGSTKSG